MKRATRTALVVAWLALLVAGAWAAAPTISGLSPDGSTTVTSNQPTIQFEVSENGAGVTDYNVSIDGTKVKGKGDTGITVQPVDTDTNRISFSVSSALSDATHTLKIGATSADSPAQYVETGTVNFTVSATTASNAPTNPRISVPPFTRTVKPKLQLKADGSPAKMRFSCSQTGPWDANHSYATSYSDFNILDQNVGCSASEGLHAIWVQYAFAASNWSDANTASTFYDVSKPSKPGNLSVAIRDTDNAVNVKWDESSDSSGSKPRYNVYRSMDLNFVGKELVSTGLAANQFFDKKGLKDGTTYYYRATAVDSAGNESEPSDAKQIVAKVIITGDTEKPGDGGKAISEGDLKIVLVRADGKETLSVRKEKVTLKGSFGKKLINVNLLFKLPGGKTLELIDASKPAESDNLDGFSKEVDASEAKSGKGQILFKAKDPDTDKLLSRAIEFDVDTDEPVADWINPEKEKASFAGKVLLKVKANDKGSGLEKAVFSYKEARTGKAGELGTVTRDDNGFYSQEWKFDGYYNGAYSVSVTVYDKAGNSVTESLKEVNLSGAKNPDKEVTEAKVVEAEARQADIDKFADRLKQKNVVSSKLTNARDSFTAKIAEAKSLQAAKNYAEAQKRVAEALAIVTGLPNLIEVREARKVDYVLDANALEKGVKEAGLDEKLVPKAVDLIKKSKAHRSLEVLEIKEGSDSTFQVNVVVSVSNPGTEAVSLKVIEVIPKEFAAKASDLRSQADFKVLNADPSIEFRAELGKGASQEFVYSLSKALSKEEARVFLDAEPLKAFPAPPLVLEASQAVGEVKPKARIDLTPVLAFLAVLVVAGLAFFSWKKFGGEGLGGVGAMMAGLLEQVQAGLKGAMPGKKKAEGLSRPSGKRVDFLDEGEGEGVISFKKAREARGFGGKRYEPLFLGGDEDSAAKKPERKLHPLERLIEEHPRPAPPKHVFREPLPVRERSERGSEASPRRTSSRD
ncbi:MAG TPA: hypothetical protein HA252_07010 [Candidatus Diapherotrites archaeon]|uniref:Fibronectin type-III domain-containing protein n=1 Tax=Candidatus Iainarchaeum sp. TaxID=3101447 RepID=A0A7J4JPJ4_9ARCH|nr:hypothetical protein [Candidatus Diapherotrites archaeon]